MFTMIGSNKFEIKQTGNKFFYWSPRAHRWLPIAAAKVEHEKADPMEDFNYVGSRHHY